MTESGWYLASTSNIDDKYRSTIGHIEGLPRIRPVALNACQVWGLDNSVYTGKFEVNSWLRRVESLQQWREKCLFVTIPDVVGDSLATLAQFREYRAMVQGWPVAFVSQDGIREHAGRIPWDDFDCLFIGGSNEHKLGKEGGWILAEAKRRGKWVHVGRINSVYRIEEIFWMADSWDGTTLSRSPSYVDHIHAAVLRARSKKKTKGLFDDIPSFNPHSSVHGNDISTVFNT